MRLYFIKRLFRGVYLRTSIAPQRRLFTAPRRGYGRWVALALWLVAVLYLLPW